MSDQSRASVTIRGIFDEALPLEGHAVARPAHFTPERVLVVDLALETGRAQVLLEISDPRWLDELESAIQVARAALVIAQKARPGVAA